MPNGPPEMSTSFHSHKPCVTNLGSFVWISLYSTTLPCTLLLVCHQDSNLLVGSLAHVCVHPLKFQFEVEHFSSNMLIILRFRRLSAYSV